MCPCASHLRCRCRNTHQPCTSELDLCTHAWQLCLGLSATVQPLATAPPPFLRSREHQCWIPALTSTWQGTPVAPSCSSIPCFALTRIPYPFSLAQHSYFNLAGHASGTILGHQLTLHGGDHYTPVRG